MPNTLQGQFDLLSGTEGAPVNRDPMGSVSQRTAGLI